MKKERQFLKDLYGNTVVQRPFIKLLQNNRELRKELFQQYLNTEIKPDVALYWESFYSSDELDKMISTKKDTPLYSLRLQFYDLLDRKELPEKYWKHSIDKTPLLK